MPVWHFHVYASLLCTLYSIDRSCMEKENISSWKVVELLPAGFVLEIYEDIKQNKLQNDRQVEFYWKWITCNVTLTGLKQKKKNTKREKHKNKTKHKKREKYFFLFWAGKKQTIPGMRMMMMMMMLMMKMSKWINCMRERERERDRASVNQTITDGWKNIMSREVLELFLEQFSVT